MFKLKVKNRDKALFLGEKIGYINLHEVNYYQVIYRIKYFLNPVTDSHRYFTISENHRLGRVTVHSGFEL